eukprot:Sro278_g106630.2  (403) ;mRNA; r:63040-64329
MDPNNSLNSRKRDRPEDDEEKVDISSNRRRTSLVNELIAQQQQQQQHHHQQQQQQGRNDVTHLVLDPRMQLLNTAFQLQQPRQQLGLTFNPNLAAAQHALRPSGNNPFAGLQGFQLHPRSAAPIAPNLLETLQARLRTGANPFAFVGGPVMNAMATGGAPTSAPAPANALVQQTPQTLQVPSSSSSPAPASMQTLSMASNVPAGQGGANQQGNQLSEADMNALLTCTDGQKLLYTPDDDWKLSPYQCLARKQIELFEASDKDLEAGAQGRNRPIVLGQLGIRCRWCASLASRQRQRASSYYPSRLEGIYQAAQNISNSHLSRLCQSVPPVIREELVRLQAKKSGAGGGKKYWSQSAKDQGVYDVEDGGLRISPSPSALINMPTGPQSESAKKQSEGVGNAPV